MPRDYDPWPKASEPVAAGLTEVATGNPPLLWITMWVTRRGRPKNRTGTGRGFGCPNFHQWISLAIQPLARILRFDDGHLPHLAQ
jgi:hypothetical protein